MTTETSLKTPFFKLAHKKTIATYAHCFSRGFSLKQL